LENRQESLNSTETYNNEDTKSLLSKCENMSLCEEKPDSVEIENDVEEEENSSDASFKSSFVHPVFFSKYQ